MGRVRSRQASRVERRTLLLALDAGPALIILGADHTGSVHGIADGVRRGDPAGGKSRAGTREPAPGGGPGRRRLAGSPTQSRTPAARQAVGISAIGVRRAVAIGADGSGARAAGSVHAEGLGQVGVVGVEKPGAVLIARAGSRVRVANPGARIAGLIEAVAARPPIEAAVAGKIAAVLEAQLLDRRLRGARRIGRIEFAVLARGVAGAVRIRDALLAKVLVAGDAAREIAARAGRVIGWQQRATRSAY
jgi:hypothetical protein